MLTALAGAFALGVHAFGDRSSAPVSTPSYPVFHQGPLFGIGPFPDPPEPSRPPLALEQVRVALAQAYYRHVSPTVLAKPSIASILHGLDDPYTDYLTPPEYETFQEKLSRRYYGVGLRVGPGEGGLVVVSSFKGPARDAGIRPGDLIVSIDGRAAGSLPFDRSTALIKGEEGTTVSLTVHRPGERRAMRFDVVRRPIAVPAVRFRMLEAKGHKLGYLGLLAFSADSALRLEQATRSLVEAGAEALVLDLRGDPGGYLVQAVRVASLFLDGGVVCSTQGVNQPERVYTVSGAAVDTERPLVVLVDHGTGSAAEIVAGALRDNGRALLIGSRTYGKGTVQSLIALSNGGALKLTTAMYRTPKGTTIDGRGLKPKQKASDDPFTRRDEALGAAKKTLLKQIAQ